MTSDEEIRYLHIRKLILANDPDNEYEFDISSSSYDRLKDEFGKDVEDDSLGHCMSPTTLINNGRSKYIMEPDGVIYFETVDGEKYKVVVEVGVSQTYDSLLDKARKWLYDKECGIVVLLAFFEKESYSAPHKRISLTSRQRDDQVVSMRRQWLSPLFSRFGPLEFGERTWLDEVSEGFIEVVRKDPDSDGTEALRTMKYVLIDNGRDISSSVPRSVGDIRLAELMTDESLGSDAAAGIVIDFFNSEYFMDIVRRAVVKTAVERFKNAVKIT
ncbi:hypothetical protein POJ06DRAFT_264557 [Lipomyces tetrasporus]|uniref:Uncharacterized protein n=1 Tax=Lipomyces tetrasporus TaxID=54092 RepID=A0AAD7R0Z1_9ASCO|nr:uncharacterized protein POJ06DRAFT_264557 [Lipomyces tetrasporus]KAJ8103727.1 hypothetical protein POJ06DRAFT_264557 [Lipomyces tetrasporus]